MGCQHRDRPLDTQREVSFTCRTDYSGFGYSCSSVYHLRWLNGWVVLVL